MIQSHRLADVLAEVRHAALEGQFDRLPELTERFGRELELYTLSARDPDTHLRLQEDARGLMALLQASRQGLRNVRDRLHEMERIRTGSGIYADNGARRSLQVPAAESRRM